MDSPMQRSALLGPTDLVMDLDLNRITLDAVSSESPLSPATTKNYPVGFDERLPVASALANTAIAME